MGNRRNKPPNRFGCKPDEDVCVEHDMPLECQHGCAKATKHKCKWLDSPEYRPDNPEPPDQPALREPDHG